MAVACACVLSMRSAENLAAAEIIAPIFQSMGQTPASGFDCRTVSCTMPYGQCAGIDCGCSTPCAGCNSACAACGCNDCCGGCCATCQPFWTVRGSALYMQRDRPDDVALMQDTDAVTPTRVFNARDFEFDWQGGYELALIAQPECGWGLEARFMSLQSSEGDASVITTTTMADPLQINTNPPTFVQDVDQVDATYDSGFHSLEFNLRRQCCDFAFLLGFRYLELDEQMVADLTGSAPAATYFIFTQNRLYGVQAGGEGTLSRCGNFRLDGVAKGGIYYNAARHSTFLSNGVITQPGLGDADNGAFVGELGLTAVYDINPCWAIRLGYQGLWFESVTLASDQIPATNLFTQTGIESDGGTFFHGGVLGLEFRR